MPDLNLNIPDLGDVEEVEVIEVCVEIGQSVEAEDSILILETDKAAMEIPTTESGIVKNILVNVGDMVKEGTPFVQIEVEEEKKSNTDQIAQKNKKKAHNKEIQVSSEKEDINKNEIVLAKPLIPDLGDVEEVEVIEICVEVGQNVGIDDSIMILETDKAAMEIPASVAGKVTKLNISLGDMVKAGMPFVEIESSVAVPKPLNKINEKEDSISISKNEHITKQEKTNNNKEQVSQPLSYNNVSVHSGPATRKLAREFGINLSEVKGSGPKGRILKEDLHAFVSQRLNSKTGSGFEFSQPDIDFSKWGQVSFEKLSKFQKTASKNLHTSWINIPHVTQHDDANITDLLALRAELNKSNKTKVSPLAYIIKATVETLKLYPSNEYLSFIQPRYSCNERLL